MLVGAGDFHPAGLIQEWTRAQPADRSAAAAAAAAAAVLGVNI